MLEIGSLVDGKYKILNKVGQGGMSVVYLAMNEKANKQWAVKEVRKDGVLDFESVKQGLVAETDILKKLNHPNLPSIIDVIDTDESFIIIMDYIQGNSLNKALEEYGAQPQENVIEWSKQLCDVLGYLHSRQPSIIYRDMKPANIMLKPDGNVTLIDFGTAREYKEKNLADTTCLGTVGYAAPEQFGGMGQTDARTDIYCLGATMYHLVTGMNPCEPPYEIKPIREINPLLSGGLERIIQKCTQRDPDDRYQSAAELMYALEHYNEIDDIYRKKQKKKLTGFLIPAVLAFVFAGTSVWGYISAENKKKETYGNILATALASDNTDNYYDAIVTDPTRTEAYEGLIKFLISDGELDDQDKQVLQQLQTGLTGKSMGGFDVGIKPLDELKEADSKSYAKVCNQAGEALLFYYCNKPDEAEQNRKKRYDAAATWFERAYKSDEKDYSIAKVYCDIDACLADIETYSKDSFAIAQKYAKYEELWEQIKNLNKKATEDISNSDINGLGMKMRIWDEIVKMIQGNLSELCTALPEVEAQDESQDEILQLLSSIKADSSNVIALNNINTEEIRESIETLQNSIETAAKNVRSNRKTVRVNKKNGTQEEKEATDK